ncbi:MAG: hypothetical protein ABI217_11555 [Chthoniobacterales bacterium]
MKIAEVLQIMNQMQSDGIIDCYAIGGAVGATFYLEPISTLDVDVFVELHAGPGSRIVTLDPIFEYLRARGCTLEGEYVVISGWPVQFLPPSSPLVEEALRNAVATDVAGTPVRVFTAEYLAAIALQTGRAKDKARLLQFSEAGVLDEATFDAILTRHNLVDRWQRFLRQFLG